MKNYAKYYHHEIWTIFNIICWRNIRKKTQIELNGLLFIELNQMLSETTLIDEIRHNEIEKSLICIIIAVINAISGDSENLSCVYVTLNCVSIQNHYNKLMKAIKIKQHRAMNICL